MYPIIIISLYLKYTSLYISSYPLQVYIKNVFGCKGIIKFTNYQTKNVLPNESVCILNSTLLPWEIFRYTLPADVKLLRRCNELMVLYYVLSFILGQCFNLLPAAVFYLAGNTRQAAFTCANIISMITTTSAYIYAYYMMYRAIKTIGCFVQ